MDDVLSEEFARKLYDAYEKSFADNPDEPKIFVCMRVDDLSEPFVSSTQDTCNRCNSAVWVTDNLRVFAEQSEVICMRCYLEVKSCGT